MHPRELAERSFDPEGEANRLLAYDPVKIVMRVCMLAGEPATKNALEASIAAFNPLPFKMALWLQPSLKALVTAGCLKVKRGKYWATDFGREHYAAYMRATYMLRE